MRVLIVDDEALSQVTASELVSDLGHSVAVVNSGTAAILAAKQERFDCVLIDVEMPGLDGFQTARAIRALCQNQPRIVALSAHPAEKMARSAQRSGISAWSEKPLTRASLEAALTHGAIPPLTFSAANTSGPSELESVASVLNPTTVRELLQLRDETGVPILYSLTQRFADDLPFRLAAMADAFEAKDFHELFMQAHALRSTSLTLGAVQVSRVTQPLERAGSLSAEDFTEQLLAVQMAVTRACTALRFAPS